jgi:hypothetical protein
MGAEDVRRVMVLEWPQLQAALPLSLPLIAGALGLIDDTLVAQPCAPSAAALAAGDVLFARREGQSPMGLDVAPLNACVGLLIVGLAAAALP